MLVTLPTGICTLKSLKELDLTGCSKFNNFPEIVEPMEQLEFLSLEGTSIKELHSSIEFLYVLKKLRLKGCEKLICLPTSICKLKSLEGLDLTGCSAFYEFPEILELMKDLEFLCLEGTLVKELPSSIKCLIGLETLDLRLCKNFEFFPNSIYSLTKLRTLSFFSCWKLETLLPATVLVSLLSLEVLDLSYSGISEIPSGLICLTSLRDLDLSGTKIKNIPASIKQASQLSRLCLIMCNRLESLPELPVICCLEADGCTSLKTVSSSRTALVQCWDKYELFPGVLKFSNCRALDRNAKSNIMADAQLRILRVATASSMFIEEDNEKYPYRRPLVTIVCPGRQIPVWFSYQNGGSSVNIELPPDWFRAGFLGFAFSVVVAYGQYPLLRLRVKFTLKNNDGESQEISRHFIFPCGYGERHDYIFNPYHMYVWYNAFKLDKEAKLSNDFYKLVTEASVHFSCPRNCPDQLLSYVKVEKCGICLLYADDAEMSFRRSLK